MLKPTYKRKKEQPANSMLACPLLPSTEQEVLLQHLLLTGNSEALNLQWWW
jgi:hypothetical protein